MKGKVIEVLKKRDEVIIDGKTYKTHNVTNYMGPVVADAIVEFSCLEGGNGDTIKFIKVAGVETGYVKPEYRQKGRSYSDKNEEWILRENVLRTAVEFAPVMNANGARICNLEGLFGMAKLMEQKIREGF
jgi:hypothetical protein